MAEMPTWPAPDWSSIHHREALLSEVVSVLSHALDLSTGQPVGHSVRTCLLAMRIAAEYGLPTSQTEDLFYATLLKDAGCSSNATILFHALGSDDLQAKRDVKTADLTRTSLEALRYVLSHVAPGKPFLERMAAVARVARNSRQQNKTVTKIRCERGSTMARLIGLSELTADAIGGLDEHWDGQGNPDGLRHVEIPLLSRFMLLAQTLEVFYQTAGPVNALAVITQRSGRWFDPAIVRAAQSVAARNQLWPDIGDDSAYAKVLTLAKKQKLTTEGGLSLDAICQSFAQIVDAKSPFTYKHSNGVANAAVAIARRLGLPRDRVLFVRHAALLHDLGKLGVSNAILEKPAKLDEAEWKAIQRHPYYTWKILNGIPGFGELSEVAASHHEKLNGSGYFRGLTAEHLSLESRILAVADIFDALAADRPYRQGMPLEKVFDILRKDAPRALDGDCVQALFEAGVESNQTFVDLMDLEKALTQFEVAKPVDVPALH